MPHHKHSPSDAAQLSDRVYIASQMFSQFIHDHPLAECRADIARLADEIEDKMADLIEALYEDGSSDSEA